MAIIKIVSPAIHPSSKRGTYAHLKTAIAYALNPKKTENGLYTGSQNCSCDTALKEMIETKHQYGKEPDINSEDYLHDRLGYHFVISWSPEEHVAAETALEITKKFCEEYLDGYEAVFAAHVDQEHMHTHIVFNSVNYKSGKKYHCPKGEWSKKLQIVLDQLCKEKGLHSLEDDTGISIDEYKEGKQKTQAKDIRKVIDDLIKECECFEDFESRLNQLGYLIGYGNSQRYGRYMKLKTVDMKRFRRTYTLGENYTIEMINFRIAAYHTLPDKSDFDSVDWNIGERIYHYHIRSTTENRYLRKQYARMYRLGLFPQKVTRMDYRERRKRIGQIRRLEYQLNMIAENDYNSKEDLDVALVEQQRRINELKEKKRHIKAEKQPYQKMFQTYEWLEDLKGAWILFQEGEVEFKEQADEYEELMKLVHNLPHTKEQLEQSLALYDHEEKELGKRIREERKKLRALEELQEQYYQVMEEYDLASSEMMQEMEQYGAEPDNDEKRQMRKGREH